MTAPKQSTHESIYLRELTFDEKLKNSFIAKYLTNFRYVFLLIIIITVVGLFSYINLPRRLNPQIKIPIVSVSTVLQGASPADVESLLTAPIEDSLSSVANVNTITSISQENVSIVTMEFNSGVNPDKAKDEVQSQIDSLATLPRDVKTPKVQKFDFENQPVWQFLIASRSDNASLMAFSKDLKDKVKNLASVKDVTLSGDEIEEIQILIKPEVQKSYNIDPNALFIAIQSAIPSHPSGNVDTDSSSFSLTIDSTVDSIEELRNLEFTLNGQPVKLSEVATVQQRPSPRQAQTYFMNQNDTPQRTVAFSVFKTDSANIDKAVTDSRKVIEDQLNAYPNQFNLVTILDTSQLISKQFNNVLHSFRDTIILVVITLFIFLGLRQALIVAFSIPLSFLVAFTVMNVMGLSINFLTLFSLILALGLLVDDAIVVVTAVTSYWRTRKFTPNQTGILVLRDFIVPIWSTTITAVWAFAPLLLATGIIGEFIKSIPIVVSTTLLASTAIAILITLPLSMVFLKPSFPKRVKNLFYILLAVFAASSIFFLTNGTPVLPFAIILAIAVGTVFTRSRQTLFKTLQTKVIGKNHAMFLSSKVKEYSQHGVIDSQKFASRYEKLITKVISSKSARRKTLVIVVLFAIFAYSLVPLGFVVNEFFPKADQDEVFLSIELPAGTNLATTQKEAQNLLEQLKDTPKLKYVTAQIGQPLSTQSRGSSPAGSNNILFTINLIEKEKRDIPSYTIAEQLRSKYRNYTAGKASVLEASSGPPAGADIQIKLSGDELGNLHVYADKIVAFLQKQPGVTNIEKSINPGTSKIVFVPNSALLATNQVTEREISQQLRSFTTGFTLAANVKFENTDSDIILRQNDSVESPQNLSTLTVRNQLGQQIPINSLGQFKLAQNPTQITRENGKRTLSVSAGVTKSYSVSQTSKKLEDFAKTDLHLPNGYEWKTGGVNEENQKSVASILEAMVLAFFLIAATMILQFGSYRKAFIILLLIPLAISGVFVIFALSGTPLSFPTLIGILALFGIVVYQAMMIVDKINRNLRITSMNLKQAVADGAASRVEPILFGTITTVMGLIPITLSDPLWRGLGGAIISGMLFSGLIMLLFIPVVYYMIYQNSEGK